MVKTMNINGRTFEVVTAPRKVAEIMERTYLGGLSCWYTKCSTTKIAIYDSWSQFFSDTATGHCSFGISSANSMTFTIVCDIELRLEEDDFYSRPYRMFITPSHNYIVKVGD